MRRLKRNLCSAAVAGCLGCSMALPAAAQSGLVLDRHAEGAVAILSGNEILLLFNDDPNLAVRTGRYPPETQSVLQLGRTGHRSVVRVGPDGTRLSDDTPGFLSQMSDGPDPDGRWGHLYTDDDTYTNYLQTPR